MIVNPNNYSGSDTDKLQKALNAAAGVDKTGFPNPVWRGHENPASPIGNAVRLSEGTAVSSPWKTWVIDRPLKVWGNTEVFGHRTLIDARALPKDQPVFQLSHVPIGGGPWQTGCYFHDLKIISGGHGFSSNEHLLNNKWERIRMKCKGGGLHFPNCYSQGNIIDDVIQYDPASYGLTLHGNLNEIRWYQIVNGTFDEFESVWDRDGSGMIDIAGGDNALHSCHVEFGVNSDRVVPFNLQQREADGGIYPIHLQNCWTEYPVGSGFVDDCGFRFEKMSPTGDWYRNHKSKFINCGHIKIGTLVGDISAFLKTEGDTFLEVGSSSTNYDCSLPEVGRVGLAHTRLYGGKWYDPNKSGENLLAYAHFTTEVYPGCEATFEQNGLDFTINVTKNVRTDGRPAAWFNCVLSEEVPWMLYSAEHINCGTFILLWGQSNYQYGPDEINRTSNGKTAGLIPPVAKGAILQLPMGGLNPNGSTKTGVATYRNVSLTKAMVF